MSTLQGTDLLQHGGGAQARVRGLRTEGQVRHSRNRHIETLLKNINADFKLPLPH